MTGLRAFGLIFAWCLLAASASARPVAGHDPAELSGKSDVICNGRVLDVKKTGEKGETVLSGNAGLAVEYWTARIKVLATFKGNASAEIELRYPELDPVKVPLVIDGPEQIYLSEGKRYLFYLKSTGEKGKYAGCLDGDFDDGAAVQPLSDGAPDNLRPLDHDTALDLADACVKKDAGFRGQVAGYEGYYRSWGEPSWQFDYFDGPPLNYPSFTQAAEIIVRTDHSIDPQSWIGTEHPRLNAAVTPKDVGRTVQITQEIGPGEISTIRGVVKKVDDAAVTVHAVLGNAENKPGDEVVVPRKELRSIQSGHGPA